MEKSGHQARETTSAALGRCPWSAAGSNGQATRPCSAPR